MLKFRLLSLAVLATFGLCQAAAASPTDFTQYDVYYGDINSDGDNRDIHLHKPDTFVLIHGDISVPLFVKEQGGYLYDANANTLSVMDLEQAQAEAFTQAQEQTDYVYGDANSDGYQDLYVYSQAKDGSGVVFYGNGTGANPSAAPFTYVSSPYNTSFASSSQLKAGQADIKIFTATESNMDVVTTAAPNASGVSVNRFAKFDVTDRPISIMNRAGWATDQFGNQIERTAAATIIVVADSVNLSKKISIAGIPADLVILTPNANGTITCTGCAFENVHRISLLTATPAKTIAPNSTVVGSVGAGPNTSITITDLYAPGSIGVDLVTRNLNFTGVIDTHMRAMKAAAGGFEFVAHGDQYVGAASVNLMLGEMTWHYETQAVQFAKSAGGSTQITGEIRSSAVNAIVAGNVVFNGYIDTRTDAVSTIGYKDGVYVPQEQVTIHALDGGSLEINSPIDSGGVISLQAAGNVLLNPTLLPLKAGGVKVLAGSKATNLNNIEANQIAFGADTVVNQGKLIADDSIELYAVNDVRNQYGGHIVGSKVQLVSENAVVRNGSRTPYISKAADENYMMTIVDGQFGRGGDVSEQGTFYGLQTYVSTSQAGFVKAQNNSAYIVADNLQIAAPAFENINPLYVETNGFDPVRFAHNLLSQVFVSAENSLSIGRQGVNQKADYILNSSAIITVNNPSAKFEMYADTIVNERYRVASILEKAKVSSSQDAGEGDQGWSSSTDAITSRTAVYSPPGSIISMTSVNFIADTKFLNYMGYIEIFGDAKIDTPKITARGLSHRGMTQTNSSWWYEYSSGGASNTTDSGTSTGYATLNPQELDSLFYVQGFSYFEEQDFDFKITNVFNYFVESSYLPEFQATFAGDGRRENYNPTYSGSEVGNSWSLKTYHWAMFNDLRNITVDYNGSQVTITGDVTKTNYTQTEEYQSGEMSGDMAGATSTESAGDTFQIWPVIEQKIAELEATWNQIATEFKWWSEEA